VTLCLFDESGTETRIPLPGRDAGVWHGRVDGLQAGQAYFLRPDWQELLNKRLVLKAEPLPEAYTPLLRTRVIDRQRQTDKTASLD
jgi:pullulanase/glycogen debranching enzyme